MEFSSNLSVTNLGKNFLQIFRMKFSDWKLKLSGLCNILFERAQGLNFIFSKEGNLPTNIYGWRGVEIFGREKKTTFVIL